MKARLAYLFRCGILYSAIGLSCLAHGTAFTYQGRLTDGDSPPTEFMIYALRFMIGRLAKPCWLAL